MDEIQVKIVQLQILQRLLECLFYLVRTVVGMPDLGSNKELITGDIAGIHCLLEGGAYRLFILVQRSGIEVAVAQIDGLTDNADAFLVIELVRT